MNNEYIIVNKSVIQKIDDLVKEANAGKTISSINSQMAESLIRFKEQLLSQSTPLIPEIEKAYNTGTNYGIYLQGGSYDPNDNIDIEDYISKLKLDI